MLPPHTLDLTLPRLCSHEADSDDDEQCLFGAVDLVVRGACILVGGGGREDAQGGLERRF